MPRGAMKHTSKSKRQASQIEDTAKKKGRSVKSAKRTASATMSKDVGKRTGGGRRRTKTRSK